jgi:hypothetical protein
MNTLLCAGLQNEIKLITYSRLQKSTIPLKIPCKQGLAFCSSEGWCCVGGQVFSKKVHLQGLKVYGEQNLELLKSGKIPQPRNIWSRKTGSLWKSASKIATARKQIVDP